MNKILEKTMTHSSKGAFDYLLNYLALVIQTRMNLYFGKESLYKSFNEIPSLKLEKYASSLFEFIIKHDLNREECLLLGLALVPHIQPDFLDQIIRSSLPEPGDFPQIGGVRGKQFRGMLPTGETALFIVAGSDIEKRLEIQHLLSEEHFFSKNRILYLEAPPEKEPLMSGKLMLSEDYLAYFTMGKFTIPTFNMSFPAQLIQTELIWEDLVLNQHTKKQVQELKSWVKHGHTLFYEWGMKKKLKLGYRALFYGPPGTGKTLTASLLGKYTGRDVFKVDLSMIVSKFIGETEKNLANLFARAENKNWILFFDEADAIFGKRTSVRDAHDKYANQEVSYLLQRIEGYNGLVILASNFKNNIDDAFTRRFQSIIHFPMPQVSERLKIWQQAFPENVSLHHDINLGGIAKEYKISGAEIMNVVQYCCLDALANEDHTIYLKQIKEGIAKEFYKKGEIKS